ncbi:unnamed protein product [Diatraea saccharalis]|uniref:Uncharacterized protein n=1 Tax=Diatraea saccharalis TaxID=40085 RepID=A0A9N9WFQ3_9NEOP|nr:unnamed protein product [Diatraea saccharalis]
MYGRSFYFPCRDLLVLLEARYLHLRELTLRCSELHDFHYAAIGKCELLVTLQLYSCWLMSEAGALHVTQPPMLRSLHITSARMVRSAALSNFLAHLPRLLEELVLSGSAFNDSHVKALQNLPMLRVLELWNCQLSGAGALVLANVVPSLHILDLDITLTNEQIKVLDNHPNLLSVRCLTEQSNKHYCRPFNVSKYGELQTHHVKIQRTNENYSHKYFRNNGEGYCASLFYYWTQKMCLQPYIY